MTEVHLFSPLQIRAVTIPNRIGLSPMCMYVAQPDGRVTDWHLVHLGARAIGGAGIVFTEAVAVAPEGRLSDGDVGLWSAGQEPGLAAIAQFVSAQGSVPAIQLAHGGRKSGRPVPWAGREPLADWGPRPSSVDVPFHPGWDAPEAMTAAQLDRVVTEFADAAERAVRCGFRFVELHFAHGYLVHQFLTPLVNTRNDDHGGDLTSRTRFAVAIVEAVRARIGDGIPLAARLSVIDWAEGGLTIDDTIEIAAVLADAGVDLIDCSSGAAVPGEVVPVSPHYQVPFSEEVRSRTGLLSAAVGLITEPGEADRVIREGAADLVLLGRAMLREADWARRAERELAVEGVEPPVPLPYRRAVERMATARW